LEFNFNWKKLSAIAGLSWWNFYFRLYPGAIKTEQVIDFLKHLQRHVKGKLLIVWDGVATHRSQLVRAYLKSLKGKIWVERLPAYAPELNPVEYLWGYWKQHELPNLCARDLWQLPTSCTFQAVPDQCSKDPPNRYVPPAIEPFDDARCRQHGSALARRQSNLPSENGGWPLKKQFHFRSKGASDYDQFLIRHASKLGFDFRDRVFGSIPAKSTAAGSQVALSELLRAPDLPHLRANDVLLCRHLPNSEVDRTQKNDLTSSVLGRCAP
jgi:transposase